MKSFFSHLKAENAYFSSCKTKCQLHQTIEQCIWFYNHERLQKN
ncbi:IS3 family transposase [Priestia endophytica]